MLAVTGVVVGLVVTSAGGCCVCCLRFDFESDEITDCSVSLAKLEQFEVV